MLAEAEIIASLCVHGVAFIISCILNDFSESFISEEYIVCKEPIKAGKYLYISFMDKNDEVKRIKIPESEVLEIVYDIKKISGK